MNRYSSAAAPPPPSSPVMPSKYRNKPYPIYHLTCLPYTKPISEIREKEKEKEEDEEEVEEDYKELTNEEFFALDHKAPLYSPDFTDMAVVYERLHSLELLLLDQASPDNFKDPSFYPFIKECVTIVLRDYARQTGQDDIYKLVEIEKVNSVMVSGFIFYITFKAASPQNESITFQAEVYQYEDKMEIHGVNIKTPGSDDRYDGKFSVPDVDFSPLAMLTTI